MLYSPFVFFNLSILFVFIYFVLFGVAFRFLHSFNSFEFFPFVLVSHLIVCFLFYVFTLRDYITAPSKKGFQSIKQHLVIISLFLLFSSFFPMSSMMNLYPKSMAVFHSILLFLISISFLSSTTVISIITYRGLLKVSGGKKVLLLSSFIVSVTVCVICMIVFSAIT